MRRCASICGLEEDDEGGNEASAVAHPLVALLAPPLTRTPSCCAERPPPPSPFPRSIILVKELLQYKMNQQVTSPCVKDTPDP